jgi:hypothetical protein
VEQIKCATWARERVPESKQTVKAHEVEAKFAAASTWPAFWAAWRQAARLTAQAQLTVIDAMQTARVRLTQQRKGENDNEAKEASEGLGAG